MLYAALGTRLKPISAASRSSFFFRLSRSVPYVLDRAAGPVSRSVGSGSYRAVTRTSPSERGVALLGSVGVGERGFELLTQVCLGFRELVEDEDAAVVPFAVGIEKA